MPDIWSLAAIVAKFTLYLGVLASAGTVFAAIIFQVSNIRRIATAFAILGMVSAIVGFLLSGAALTGDASGLTDPAILGLLWKTPVGTALAYRILGMVLVILGLLIGRIGLYISAAGGGLALWSFAAVGHVAGFDRSLMQAILTFHLGAVALWIGILVPLKRLIGLGMLLEVATLGRRFGLLASLFIPLLILAGLIMSYALIGSTTILFASGYGQALILKVALVSGLLGFAAFNKMCFVPKLAAGDAGAAVHLSKSISFEWAIIFAILIATATLTSVLTLPS